MTLSVICAHQETGIEISGSLVVADVSELNTNLGSNTPVIFIVYKRQIKSKLELEENTGPLKSIRSIVCFVKMA